MADASAVLQGQTPARLVFDKPYGARGTSKCELPPGGSHLARHPAEEQITADSPGTEPKT